MDAPQRRLTLAALAILGSVVAAGCTGPSSSNQPPVASFEVPKPVVEVNEPVALNGSLSLDAEGKLILYQWNFGDGSTEVGAVVAHAFSASGTYTITLTVSDDQGAQNAHAENITVNAPPTAFLDVAPGPYFAKEEVAFSAALSRDSDGRIDSYTWQFGDGASASGASVAHAFADTGSFEVVLTVADNHGARSNATASLFVDLHTYDVSFAEDTSEQPPVRNFTLANTTKTVTLEVFPENLTRLSVTLAWRDPLPVMGPPNDVIQMRIISPDGPSQVAVGSFDNITIEFNLNGIPSPVQVRAATPGDVPGVLGDAYIGLKGIGVWVVEITPLELGGGLVEGQGFVPEPFFFWTLTTSLTVYEAAPTQIA